MGQKRKSSSQPCADKERYLASPDDLDDQGNVVRLNQPCDDHTTKKRRTRQHRKDTHSSEDSTPLDSPATKTDLEGDVIMDSSSSDGELICLKQAPHLQIYAMSDKTVVLHGHLTGVSPPRLTRSRSLSVHFFRSAFSTTSTVPYFHKSNPEHKEPQTIVNDVLDIISDPARGRKGLNHYGYIYILRDPFNPNYVKIGRTKDPTRRKNQIVKCHQQSIEWVDEQEHIQVAYHERLEKIIHADLYNERHHFECTCHHSANGHHADLDESKNSLSMASGSRLTPKQQSKKWSNGEIGCAKSHIRCQVPWEKGTSSVNGSGEPGTCKAARSRSRKIVGHDS